MNKKVLFIMIVALVFAGAAFAITHSTQDFEGLFTMDVPLGKHYRDVAYCWPSGGLGSTREYWEVNAGCDIEDGDIVIYYYNDSYLIEGESNALQHAVNALTTSYLYESHNEGNLIVMTNDLDMRKMPPYLAGVSNDDGSEAVFVGGRNLNDVKHNASSIEFK